MEWVDVWFLSSDTGSMRMGDIEKSGLRELINFLQIIMPGM